MCSWKKLSLARSSICYYLSLLTRRLAWLCTLGMATERAFKHDEREVVLDILRRDLFALGEVIEGVEGFLETIDD